MFLCNSPLKTLGNLWFLNVSRRNEKETFSYNVLTVPADKCKFQVTKTNYVILLSSSLSTLNTGTTFRTFTTFAMQIKSLILFISLGLWSFIWDKPGFNMPYILLYIVILSATCSGHLEDRYTGLSAQKTLFEFSFFSCISKKIRWSGDQWFRNASNYFEMA